MTQMRKIIAQRMIESRRTSAHVHCMFEVDITRIVTCATRPNFRIRAAQWRPPDLHAVLCARRHHRAATVPHRQRFARRRRASIRYHRNVNVGIAVALDWGLIVPVLKNAGDLNFLGLQRGITDLGERARNKKLKPEDVEGSTFTITNPGQFGAVFGLPIINQPNSPSWASAESPNPLVVTDAERQRLHRHPLGGSSDPGLRPPPYRRRRRRPVHGVGQKRRWKAGAKKSAD